MTHMRNFARWAILPVFALFLLAGGCGDGPPNLDPEGGEKLKQARINAYGKSGYATAKGSGSGAVSSGGAQGAARAAAQRGGR